MYIIGCLHGSRHVGAVGGAPFTGVDDISHQFDHYARWTLIHSKASKRFVKLSQDTSNLHLP